MAVTSEEEIEMEMQAPERSIYNSHQDSQLISSEIASRICFPMAMQKCLAQVQMAHLALYFKEEAVLNLIDIIRVSQQLIACIMIMSVSRHS